MDLGSSWPCSERQIKRKFIHTPIPQIVQAMPQRKDIFTNSSLAPVMAQLSVTKCLNGLAAYTW